MHDSCARRCQDRAAEVFGGNVASRPWEALFRGMGTSETFRKEAWAKQPFIVSLDDEEASAPRLHTAVQRAQY
eukprot:1682078-Rhodomonas_salina.1